ncbi:hypothetical protein [Paramaledivibacter caminithermalis]|jgi:hypothetical protein|uniref:Uncharacterized protein n=1 Tax=Paramaledivibacter caminithermalis (strain DSM 15212 / CIP 107654 / DViRD3) TaxID=1121301 RepID=A0A1M6QAS3_PARC5|nr:hypothetical protein [Paramaledivibacter caminithermalis]SHK17369.1 hypothetical protein SAMN02745912_02505 [Paramaledivibacter caminithermalis DSM 15212]
MAILKTSFRLVLLILLCIPIAYFEFYILKNALNDVINHSKKNSSKVNNAKANYYNKEYLKVAK